MPREDFNVIIIGAGSAGLLIAQRLKTLRINYTVFEREEYLNARSRDWSFGIYWAHDSIEECLPQNLKARLGEAQVDPFTKPSEDSNIPLIDGETGNIFMRVPTPLLYRLVKSRTRTLLSEGVNVQYGKRLQDIRSTDNGKAVAVFEDGSEASADLIIGADGAHSRVREILLDSEKAALQQLPLVGCRVITSLPADLAIRFREDISPLIAICYHPDGMLAFVSLHDVKDPADPASWLWMLHLGWRFEVSEPLPSTEEAKRQWTERSSKLVEPFRSMFLGVQGDPEYSCDRTAHWPTVAWNNRQGTVTLAGDAAHPMTYHRGQGLNNAFLDAAYLCRAINEYVTAATPIEEALSRYESEVVKRGHQAVLESGENSLKSHDWQQMRQAQIFKMGVKGGKEA